MAARQLPHRLVRGARHSARPAPPVLPPAAPHRLRRVRRRAPHLRAGARADRLERRPAGCAASAAFHQRIPVRHAVDDGRTVGVAERPEAGAPGPFARARRCAGEHARAPAGGRAAVRLGRGVAGRRVAMAGRDSPCVRHAPAPARAGARRDGVAAARSARGGARGARRNDRGRHSRQRTARGGRAGDGGQPDHEPAADRHVRLERVLREREPGRAGAAARSGRGVQPDGFPQPRQLPPRHRGAGGADRRGAAAAGAQGGRTRAAGVSGVT